VAIVTDAKLGEVVAAEIKHFAAGQAEAARQ
jgi:hypothetical protein